MKSKISASTPVWLDPQAYPFTSQWVRLPEGRMHYADEGKGEVVLFIHGTPAWSFLYRTYIRQLSTRFRCIAPDHLGFGLSDKPPGIDYRPKAQAKRLAHFIEELNLTGITLVVHDFGGPIGLGAAMDIPDRIKRVVMFNTWLWETASLPAVVKIDRLVSSRLGRWLYVNLNFSPRFLLKKGFAHKQKLTGKLHQAYLGPFPHRQSREGVYGLAKGLKGDSVWYASLWKRLDTLAEKPWLILWGMKDEFITPDFLKTWKKALPSVEVHTYEVGHFVQEEAPQETMEQIAAFLRT
ncbi:MAG: alpha/beta fold hydrolase [Bacteroidota bacterium]